MACSNGVSISSANVGQLVAGRPRVGDVTGGQVDLDGRGEHRRPRREARVLGEHAPDRHAGRVDVALGQPQQGDAGSGIPAELGGRSVGRRRLGELTSQAVQLTLLIAGETEGRVERVRQALAGPLRLDDRLGPLAVGLQHLRAVHEALPAVRHEVGLGRAPRVQRLGPLGCPAQLEHVDARLDHGAVHDPGGDRADLARCHRHHRLVEQLQPARDLPEGERRLAAARACRGRGGRDRRTGRRCRGSARPARTAVAAIACLERVEEDRDEEEPAAAHVGPASSTSRSARASHPLPRAVSPRRRRATPSQNPHRAARSGSPAARHREVGRAPRPGRCRRPRRRGGRRPPAARGRRCRVTGRTPAARTPRATNVDRTPRARRRFDSGVTPDSLASR